MSMPQATSSAAGNNLFCIKCGAENPADADFCHKCGKKLFRSLPDHLDVPSAISAPESAGSQTTVKPVPAMPLATPPATDNSSHNIVAIRIESDAERIRRERPDLIGIGGWLLWACISLTLFLPVIAVIGIVVRPSMYSLLILVLAVLGVVGGIQLWSVVPKAPLYIKTFLWIQLCLGALLSLVQIASETAEPGQGGTISAGPMITGAIIWLLYFAKSKRVKATFVQQPRAVEQRSVASLADSTAVAVLIGNSKPQFTINTSVESPLDDATAVSTNAPRLQPDSPAGGSQAAAVSHPGSDSIWESIWTPIAICVGGVFLIGIVFVAIGTTTNSRRADQTASERKQYQQLAELAARAFPSSQTEPPGENLAEVSAQAGFGTGATNTHPTTPRQATLDATDSASICPSALPAGVKSIPLSPTAAREIVATQADHLSSSERTVEDTAFERYAWDTTLHFVNGGRHCIVLVEVEFTLQDRNSIFKEQHRVAFTPNLAPNKEDQRTVFLSRRTKKDSDDLSVVEWRVTRVWGFDYHHAN